MSRGLAHSLAGTSATVVDLNIAVHNVLTDVDATSVVVGGIDTNSFNGDNNDVTVDPFDGVGVDVWYDDGSNRTGVPVHRPGHGRGASRPRRPASGGVSRCVGDMAPPLTGHGRGKHPAASEGGRATRGRGKGKVAYKPPQLDASEAEIDANS